MSNTMLRVDEAAARMAVRLPFISTIFSSCVRIESDKIPTAGVRKNIIAFNPAFVEKLDDEELLFVCMHEALHAAYLHTYRVGDRDPQVWNIAADAIINQQLLDIKQFPPKMPMHNGKPTGVLIPGVTGDDLVEDLYQKLMQDAKMMPQSGGAGGFDGQGDLEGDDGAIPDDGSVSESEMATVVLQAAKTAYASGDRSTLLERIMGNARPSNTDWKEELRSACILSARNDYSFNRFNRRFIWQDVYLPTLYSEEIGELVVGVDESGSMSQEQLNVIQAELIPIVEDVRPQKVTVMYCHTHVHRIEEFGQGEEIRLTLTQSGGTDMMEILRKITERNIRPAACIIFTDLETPWDHPEPEYPLLFGAVSARKDIIPPIGRRVEVPV